MPVGVWAVKARLLRFQRVIENVLETELEAIRITSCKKCVYILIMYLDFYPEWT